MPGGGSTMPASSLRGAYDTMLLGLISTLEKRAGVGEIRLLELPPATPERIAATETKLKLRCVLHEYSINIATTLGLLMLLWHDGKRTVAAVGQDPLQAQSRANDNRSAH
jgi:hypothetical protein